MNYQLAESCSLSFARHAHVAHIPYMGRMGAALGEGAGAPLSSASGHSLLFASRRTRREGDPEIRDKRVLVDKGQNGSGLG